jgi:hypothetical protein
MQPPLQPLPLVCRRCAPSGWNAEERCDETSQRDQTWRREEWRVEWSEDKGEH